MKRIFALVLALLLSSSALALPAISGDGILESAIVDDGAIRVYLKSLSAPQQLSLTLDGLYSVENDAGFRFERGTKLSFIEADGEVWMKIGGLSLNMGSAVTLTRMAAEGENGLRIAETGRDNLFEGDLSLSAENGGGLRAVLKIHIEDYLCGVVAYEMSDSWPIEALKAQAVAARTYAMQRKWSAGTRDYDLVDTTADQVFRGLNSEYTNVIQAVRATEGVVGTYKGGFASCYYTASNGGETALPGDVWSGGGDYDYLARTADPYDLENPNSMVNSVEFARDASDLPELRAMLQEELEKNAPEFDAIIMEEILSIEPANPVAEGSIMHESLRFTLRASALEHRFVPKENDPGQPMPPADNANANLALHAIDALRRLVQQAPYELVAERVDIKEPFTVELSVFEDIKHGLNLSINGGDYEVVSVVEGPDSYAIEFRRFGHGVGMSQRGAQRMAGVHGKLYTEILKFYYPGMNLERIAWDEPALPELEALPDSVGRARPEPTPKPTPAPLPPLQEGERYARVTLADASSAMNLHQQPGTQYPVVAQLDNQQRVILSGEPDAEGWIAVRTAEYSGYAKIEFLTEE